MSSSSVDVVPSGPQTSSANSERSPLRIRRATFKRPRTFASPDREDQDETDRVSLERAPTPLPLKQLFILCTMRITEPVSFTVIFPFINQMVEDLHIASDRTQVGTYAGLIESLFALSQLCTVLFWGRLSDRIGRKPVLLSGLLGLSIGIIAFGVQRTFIGLLLARSFAGAMNGNIAVVKSALAEITDDTNKARAFPLVPLANALGMTIGPAIGGYTAEPAKQYPRSIFAHSSFFAMYPYFLPCLLAGLLNLLAFGLGVWFLDETLPSKQKRSLRPSDSDNVGYPSEEEGEEPESAPRLKDLLVKPILLPVLSFGFLNFENTAWFALVPLFSYTRIEDGGLGLSLSQIGIILSSNGAVALVVQSLLFPILQKKMGTVQLFRVVKLSVPISFMSLPLVGVLTKQAVDESRSPTAVAMTGMVIVIGIKTLGNMGVVCATLLINDSAPNHAALGTINGLAQSFASFSKAIAPFVIGKLFSMTLSNEPGQIIKSNLLWIFLFVVTILGYLTTWMIDTQPHHTQKRKSKRPKPVDGPADGITRTETQPTQSYGTI